MKIEDFISRYSEILNKGILNFKLPAEEVEKLRSKIDFDTIIPMENGDDMSVGQWLSYTNEAIYVAMIINSEFGEFIQYPLSKISDDKISELLNLIDDLFKDGEVDLSSDGASVGFERIMNIFSKINPEVRNLMKNGLNIDDVKKYAESEIKNQAQQVTDLDCLYNVVMSDVSCKYAMLYQTKYNTLMTIKVLTEIKDNEIKYG